MGLTIDVAGVAVSLPAVLALGAAVGYVAGMFGVGGGFLLTPLLAVVFRVPLAVAVGTGLCQVVGTSLATLLRFRRVGLGELRVDALMLAGSILGVEAGARVLSALSGAAAIHVGDRAVPAARLVVELAYVVMLALVAALFWRQGGPIERLEYVRRGPFSRVAIPPLVRLPSVPLADVSATVTAFIGLALGFLSGLLGIGGGVALMPVLVYGFGFPMRHAAGTGVALLFATSVVGTFAHAMRGNVSLPLAIALLAGSTISAQLGALATRRLPARRLRRVFAFVVLGTVVAIAWDVVRAVS